MKTYFILKKGKKIKVEQSQLALLSTLSRVTVIVSTDSTLAALLVMYCMWVEV